MTDAPKRTKEDFAVGRHATSYRPPTFFTKLRPSPSWKLCHISASQIALAECHISFSTAWSLMALLLRNLSTLGRNASDKIEENKAIHWNLNIWRLQNLKCNATPLNSKTLLILLTREIWRRRWHCLTLNVKDPKRCRTNDKVGATQQLVGAIVAIS